MPAIIAIIFANLPELIKLGQAGYNLIMAARAAMQQSGEWTADLELEFQSKLAAESIDPAWLPDNGEVAVTTAPALPALAADAVDVVEVAAAIAAPAVNHTRVDGTSVQVFN